MESAREMRESFQSSLEALFGPGRQEIGGESERSDGGALSAHTKNILLQVGGEQREEQHRAASSSSSSSSGTGWGHSHSMSYMYNDRDEDHVQPLSWDSPNVQAIAMREVPLLSLSEAELVLKEVPLYGSNPQYDLKKQTTGEQEFEDRDGELTRGQQQPQHLAANYQEAVNRVRENVEAGSAHVFSILPKNKSHAAQSAFSKGLCGFGEHSE